MYYLALHIAHCKESATLVALHFCTGLRAHREIHPTEHELLLCVFPLVLIALIALVALEPIVHLICCCRAEGGTHTACRGRIDPHLHELLLSHTSHTEYELLLCAFPFLFNQLTGSLVALDLCCFCTGFVAEGLGSGPSLHTELTKLGLNMSSCYVCSHFLAMCVPTCVHIVKR